MTFDEYLVAKKIDREAFMKDMPEQFSEWQSAFELQHIESFTSQRKFSLNKIRRKYLLKG